MTDKDAEIWAYDEPHEFGGNVHVTMTRRQAIDWMRVTLPHYALAPDQHVFNQWVALHWAYQEEPAPK